MFRDRFGKVIYVGKARDLRRRLGNYFQPSRKRTGDAKLRSLINSIAEWSFTVVRNEDVFGGYTHTFGKLSMLSYMLLLTVDGNKILRLDYAHHELELFLAGVA